MSNNTSYDKALLDEAPEVTPQQRQRFYDADLLNDDRQREGGALPAGAAAPAGATHSNTDLEAGTGPGPAARSKEYSALPPTTTRKTPWYKTRKGIIGLVILAIIIIGAVVGGAVGATVGNDDDDNNNDESGNTGNSGDAGGDQASTLGPSISVTPTDQGSAPVGTAVATAATATQAPVGTGDPEQPVTDAVGIAANEVPTTV